MNSNDQIEEKLLSSLRGRPDKDPDSHFVQELRHHLTHGGSSQKKRSYTPIKAILSMGAVAAILFVLSTNFFGDYQQATPETPTPIVPEETDFQVLLDSNSAYDELYQQVVKVTGMQEEGKKLVLYLDAAINHRPDVLKSILYQPSDEMIEQVQMHYQNVVADSIKLKAILPDVDNEGFEVIFSFQRGELEQMKNLFLRIENEKDLKVEDPMMLINTDMEKDERVQSFFFGEDELINELPLGVTKDETRALLGTDFVEVDNDIWVYRFLVEEGTPPLTTNPYTVDKENIRNQNIGAELIIDWSPEGEALAITMYYGRSGKWWIFKRDENGVSNISEDGTVINPENEFSLTDEERNAYEWFRLEQNEENLKGLSPISVAKLYIQAQLDEDYVTEYALYTTRPDRVQWTLEEHLEFSKEPLTEEQKKQIISQYKNIELGEFIPSGENEGYISFMGIYGDMGFQMVKDESGVWKVSFMPIQ